MSSRFEHPARSHENLDLQKPPIAFENIALPRHIRLSIADELQDTIRTLEGNPLRRPDRITYSHVVPIEGTPIRFPVSTPILSNGPTKYVELSPGQLDVTYGLNTVNATDSLYIKYAPNKGHADSNDTFAQLQFEPVRTNDGDNVWIIHRNREVLATIGPDVLGSTLEAAADKVNDDDHSQWRARGLNTTEKNKAFEHIAHNAAVASSKEDVYFCTINNPGFPPINVAVKLYESPEKTSQMLHIQEPAQRVVTNNRKDASIQRHFIFSATSRPGIGLCHTSLIIGLGGSAPYEERRSILSGSRHDDNSGALLKILKLISNQEESI